MIEFTESTVVVTLPYVKGGKKVQLFSKADSSSPVLEIDLEEIVDETTTESEGEFLSGCDLDIVIIGTNTRF